MQPRQIESEVRPSPLDSVSHNREEASRSVAIFARGPGSTRRPVKRAV